MSNLEYSDRPLMSAQRQSDHRWPPPLAGRLPVDAKAGQIADLVSTLWLEIEQTLHPVIGHRGVAALYNRSLTLAAAAHPWLAVEQPALIASLNPAALRAAMALQPAAQAAAGGSALFTTFHGLLTSLVGPSLTDRLLQPVWAHPSTGAPGKDSTS